VAGKRGEVELALLILLDSRRQNISVCVCVCHSPRTIRVECVRASFDVQQRFGEQASPPPISRLVLVFSVLEFSLPP
jgi:hypothetical protein